MFYAALEWLRSTYLSPPVLWAWAMILVSYAIFHGVERIWPIEPNQPYAGIATNLLITFAYIFLGPAANFASGYFVTSTVQTLGGPWLSFDLNSLAQHVPSAIKFIGLCGLALLPVLVYDFFYYWFHRMQHASPWLWAQHKLHHTDESLNVTTALRHHWLEDFFRAFVITIPMGALIKMEPVQAGVFTMMLGQWGNLIHANLRISLGPLTPVTCGPQVHRIHHSIERQHWNKNFAAFFPIWDIVFGTYLHPKKGEFPKTGVPGEASNPGLYLIVAEPFLFWGRKIRALRRPTLRGRPSADLAKTRYPDPADEHVASQSVAGG